MRGVVFLGGRDLDLLEFEDPTPGEFDVVLATKASGMCGSDLRKYRLPKPSDGSLPSLIPGHKPSGPTVAGHEIAGVIAAVGSKVDPRLASVGDRVMVHHYQGCTQCNHCHAGWQQLCQEVPVKVYGGNANGGHAPFVKVPANTIVKLHDDLSFEAGAAISCGTGTAYAALRRMEMKGGTTLAVFGQGPVGLSATQLAKAMGSRVIALDISDERLQKAKELGADEVINPSDTDEIEAIKELTGGRFAEYTLDTSGTAAGRKSAIRSTGVWGTMGFVGEGGEVTVDVSGDLLRRQLNLVASWTFSTVLQSECAEFVVDRKLDIGHLFTDRWALEDASLAYRKFDNQTSGKGVFLF